MMMEDEKNVKNIDQVFHFCLYKKSIHICKVKNVN